MTSILRSTLHGAFGFAAVSVAAYSVWACVPRLAGGEYGMYALIALVFLGGSGLLLSGLLEGDRRLGRFYRMFVPAFFGYALLWSVAWFAIKGRPSEWIGAVAGTLFFSVMCWHSLRRPSGLCLAAVVLFALHTAGYFVGAKWMYGVLGAGIEGWTRPQVAIVAKLGWGLFHGFGFGAGIGFALGWWQRAGVRN